MSRWYSVKKEHILENSTNQLYICHTNWIILIRVTSKVEYASFYYKLFVSINFFLTGETRKQVSSSIKGKKRRYRYWAQKMAYHSRSRVFVLTFLSLQNYEGVLTATNCTYVNQFFISYITVHHDLRDPALQLMANSLRTIIKS